MATILKPLINEKSMRLVQGDFYTFEVHRDATKEAVSKIVKKKFGVDVISAKSISIPPKKKMQRSRRNSYLSGGIKKIIVKIKKGQKIALFEAPVEEEEVEIRTAEGEKVTAVKEKKSLLRGTKVKIETNVKNEEKTELKNEEANDKAVRGRQQTGKTKGEK